MTIVTSEETIPSTRDIYTNSFGKSFKIGTFFSKLKSGIKKGKTTYKDRLYSNPFIKNNIENFLNPIHDFMFHLLVEYFREFQKVPLRISVYKNENIGYYYNNIKNNIKKEKENEIYNTYNKLCEVDTLAGYDTQIVKNELDEFLNKCLNKKTDEEIFIDMNHKLLNYTNIHGKMPSKKEKHNIKNDEDIETHKLSVWWNDTKQKKIKKEYMDGGGLDTINNLIKNPIIQQNIDDFLKKLDSKK